MKPLSDFQGMLLVGLAATLWGSIGFVVALLSGGVLAIDPLLIACGRVALAAPVLWVWHRARSGRWGITLSKAHVLVLVAAGVVFALYHVTYFAAIPRVGLTYAVLLNICTAPLFAMIIARVALAERIQRAQILAVALAVLGCVVLVGGVHTSVKIDLVGVVLAVAAGLCYASLTVLTRRIAPECDAVTIQAVIMTVAALVLGTVLVGTQTSVHAEHIPWAALAYLALVPTVLSYVLYTRGLSVVRATTAASLTLLEPLVSTVLAVGFLAEQLSLVSWLGAVLLGASLVWAGRLKG